MQIETRPIAALKASPHNARVHGAEQLRQLAESIRQFGFNQPVLVDERGEIIAGHGRVEAAKQAGLAEVPVVVIRHLTEDRKRAYMLADNRIALNSEWDEDALRRELEGLEAHFADFGALGFDGGELDRLFGEFVGEPGTSVLDDNTGGPVDEEEDLEDVEEDAEDESPPGETAQPQTASARLPVFIPVLVNLTRPEYERWKAVKKELGETDNSKAFKALSGIEQSEEEAA